MATTPAPTPAKAGTPPQRSILRDTSFLRLWAGTTASGLATWALPFVLGLAVLHRQLGPAALGLLLAARTVGFLAAVAVGGVLADRHSRRAVVLWSALAAAAAAPLLTAGLGRSLVLMTTGAVLAGAGQGACRPAFQALTAETVDPGRRQEANAAMTLAVRTSTLTGPALTAMLAAVFDIRTQLLGIGLLWLVAALIPGKGANEVAAAEPTARAGLRAEFLDGIREARRHPWFLAGLAALGAVIALGYSATSVALPMISRYRYDTQWMLAAAMTAYTVGALAGALATARLRPRSRGWAAFAGLAAYGVAPLSLVLPVHAVVVVAAYAVAGIGIELFNVPWFTAIQREVAPDKLARVSSLDFLVSYGLAPIGLALIVPAINAFGVTAVLSTCAAACFLVPTAAAFVPTARHFGPTVPETGK
ncbi:MFS transporter [Streptomyces sp. H27-H1]|uniref:MFS transporter n=1 Tax=Streptomyces sp. H27-H1 TaxID=2996461 RepID=UPI0022704664|nr:MFS transporter [Streptomyces sp. H27-H1]MCY0931620.1 MFS transporter [Streptomyces sp. H27-H1]